MPSVAKLALYRAARTAGLFALARRKSRNRLRILAYHGFARRDEAQFRTKLFIRPETFRRRLRTLRDLGYRVVTLDEAVRQITAGRIEPDTVAITIDDGFASTLAVAAPLLQEFGMPATVYLTTYYMTKQAPVFDLVLAYLVWKSGRTTALQAGVARAILDRLDLSSAAAKARSVGDLIALGRTFDSESERAELCRGIGNAVGVDYDEVVAAGSFRLLTFAEARELPAMGVSIGLHTHRHRFPAEDLAVCRREIEENRSVLSRELGGRYDHFCYPSGVYAPGQWPLLAELGMASATTCDVGLAAPRDPPYGLRRFLDGELVTDIEFEAELCGFAGDLRAMLRRDRLTASR